MPNPAAVRRWQFETRMMNIRIPITYVLAVPTAGRVFEPKSMLFRMLLEESLQLLRRSVNRFSAVAYRTDILLIADVALGQRLL